MSLIAKEVFDLPGYEDILYYSAKGDIFAFVKQGFIVQYSCLEHNFVIYGKEERLLPGDLHLELWPRQVIKNSHNLSKCIYSSTHIKQKCIPRFHILNVGCELFHFMLEVCDLVKASILFLHHPTE